MDIPFYYDYQNVINSSQQPANTYVLQNEMGRFYQRYLLKKAISVFKWDLPLWWNKDYFLYTLYCWGFLGIFKVDSVIKPEDENLVGVVIPQQCGLQGYNVFYNPRKIVVANPILGRKTYDIDTDCVLMKLQSDFTGVMDLCNHYASKMALASSAIDINLWNTRIASVFFAESESEQQTFKKLYDKIAAGEPAVVVKKNLRDENGKLRYEIFNRDVKASYIVGDLLSDLRKIEAEFDTRIGLPNANTDKRERLITDEVNANNVETNILSDGWKDNIDIAIDKVRDMFGLEIKCERRYKDGNIGDNDNMGTI